MLERSVLESFKIGFEFEFFSHIPMKQLPKKIKEYTGKKITIPYSYDTFNKKKVGTHTSFVPTDKNWKIEYDHSGDVIIDGKVMEMFELVTGPTTYFEARQDFINILKFIDENGFTTKKAGIHVNLGFNSQKEPRLHIQNMNRLKMCLHFNEDEIYKVFPNRKKNAYCQSIKDIDPVHPIIFKTKIQTIIQENYLTPSTKYFGINFLKQEKNYLEFRYLGGEDYQKKSKEILNLTDFFCENIYHVLKNPQFEPQDVKELNRILDNRLIASSSLNKLEDFSVTFPDIILLVDLMDDKEIIKTFYESIYKPELYKLITFCNLKKGILNYDTTFSKIQIKGAVLEDVTRLKNYDLINCTVNGFIDMCELYHCTVDTSHITNSSLQTNCLVKNSKIENTPIKLGNKIVDCFINNKDKIVSGVIENSIIRSGQVTLLASIDKNTTKPE